MYKKYPISIAHWSAWAPNISAREEWRQWSSGQRYIAKEGSPSVKFLPAMQRRRLSLLSKMALKVAYGCHCSGGPIQTIFCSRHGELHRSAGLLLDIAAKEALSPTAFSMSVHNTASGMYSIARKDQSPSSALACGHDTFAAAFAEAVACLHSNRADKVMLVVVEELLPELYAKFEDHGACTYAMAFVLTQSNGDSGDLSFSIGAPVDGTAMAEPQALSFLRFLLNKDDRLLLAGERISWIWERACSV